MQTNRPPPSAPRFAPPLCVQAVLSAGPSRGRAVALQAQILLFFSIAAPLASRLASYVPAAVLLLIDAIAVLAGTLALSKLVPLSTRGGGGGGGGGGSKETGGGGGGGEQQSIGSLQHSGMTPEAALSPHQLKLMGGAYVQGRGERSRSPRGGGGGGGAPRGRAGDNAGSGGGGGTVGGGGGGGGGRVGGGRPPAHSPFRSGSGNGEDVGSGGFGGSGRSHGYGADGGGGGSRAVGGGGESPMFVGIGGAVQVHVS
jgi:hypothetical protein